MSEVIWHTTMSLDGFIAGPDDAMDWLFDNPGGEPIRLQRIACTESGQVTDLRFRPTKLRRTS